MTYQIDQSGKIEQTNWPTIICLANGLSKTLKISSTEKQRLVKSIIEIDWPKKNYKIKIFAALILLLLNQSKHIKDVQIDKEYYGHEADIKDMLLKWSPRLKIKLPSISFVLVGKKCNAHLLGIKVFRNQKRADIVTTAEDVIKVVYGTKIKSGRRSRSSRDNP